VKQRLPFWLVLASCAALLGPALFVAHAHADDTLGYEASIRAGVQEYERGNWLEAIELFRRAHALAPSARTHRGLGLSYFEARRYALAVQHLTAALADTRRPLTAVQRKEVRAALARSRALVGEVALVITPDDALVLVDGRALERGERTLALDAGSHKLEVSKPGYATQRRTVDVAGEQHLDLRIELEASGTVPALAAPAPATAALPTPEQTAQQAPAATSGEGATAANEPSKPVTKRWWFWTGIGAVVVGGTAVALAVALGGDSAGRAPYYEGNGGSLQGP
jgi:tetratricopeptide (TPR) repeat protein